MGGITAYYLCIHNWPSCRILRGVKGLLETTDLNIICPATAENLLGLLRKVEKSLVSSRKTHEVSYSWH